MPRIKTKWLVAWFAVDGTYKDAVERLLTGAPRKWAQDRCSNGETYQIWNISDAEDEKRIREMLDRQDTRKDVISTSEGTRYRCVLCKSLFPHEAIYYIQGDHGYTKFCVSCCEKPEAQNFLPYYERLARGIVSNNEIANWNAFHDM